MISAAAHAAPTTDFVIPSTSILATTNSITDNFGPSSGTIVRLLMDDRSGRRPTPSAVKKQAAMQDGRLPLCEESGKNWEQCFFYGTATTSHDSDEKANIEQP
jgi:hypothetical protein